MIGSMVKTFGFRQYLDKSKFWIWIDFSWTDLFSANDVVSASFDSSLDPPQVSISSHDSPEHHSLIISDEQVQTCSINGFDTMLLNGGGKETLVACKMLCTVYILEQ